MIEHIRKLLINIIKFYDLHYNKPYAKKIRHLFFHVVTLQYACYAFLYDGLLYGLCKARFKMQSLGTKSQFSKSFLK